MKIEVTVPTSLSEIPLKDYQKFVKIAAGNEDDFFIKQKMIQIFCHVPLIAVTKMKRKDFNSISSTLLELLNKKPKLITITEIAGRRYGFIPSLQEDMTVGEFTDLDGFMKDWKDFHKAMAVLYRPITAERKGKYQIESYEPSEERDQVMQDMNMEVVMGAVLFFWTLSEQLLRITPRYLELHLTRNKKAAEALEKNGVGISTFINLLEVASLKLEGLLPYTWERPYST